MRSHDPGSVSRLTGASTPRDGRYTAFAWGASRWRSAPDTSLHSGDPEVNGRFKTIWYRVGETLFRRTAVKGRTTYDTSRLFAENPGINPSDYEKTGDPFFQKRFERVKVL